MNISFMVTFYLRKYSLNLFSFWTCMYWGGGSQKSCNILAIIWQFQIPLQMSWRWWTTLDHEMLSSPDTLQVLLASLASTDWSIASKSQVLNLPDLALSMRFLQPKWNFLSHLLLCSDQLCLHFLHNKYF